MKIFSKIHASLISNDHFTSNRSWNKEESRTSLNRNNEREQMGWNYPEICLEDLMKLVKGFIDMIILASGYRSSGLVADWDSENIKKALQWGLFFENVLKSITSSETYSDSVRELDEAISEMKSDPLFPQGLANLSSDTLSRARDFVLEHLINNPLRDKHLRAILVATMESGDDDVMKFTVQELLKRQSEASCVSTLEKSLDVLYNTIGRSSWTKDQLKPCEAHAPEGRRQLFLELSMWNLWKSRSLSYFLSKRTIRLVSGASLIFASQKVQWAEVFGRLHVSSKSGGDILHEKIELLLLGCVAGRWTRLLEHFMSVSYNSVCTSGQYDELCKLLHQTSRNFSCKEGTSNLKVDDILEYLTELLGGKVHPLWNLPPALTAVALPSWSPLFDLYFGEIEKRMKVDFSATRCYSCKKDVKEQKDCEIAERVWCLYIFHVCGFHQMNDS